ncbi:MAG TPA: PAS domain S-box protein [Methanosarcina sp.]|nr:PAS domain S-box protein [Methanosarcina sp.]
MPGAEKCRGRKGMTDVQINMENPKIEPLFQDNCYFIKGMLNAMLNPVCYKDRNGVYLGVNDIYARQIAGLPEEEVVGCTMLEVGQKVAERFPERALVSGRPLMEHVREWHRHDIELFQRGGTSIHEYEGICADGIRREFLANRSTFSNGKGEILGLITILQDITERNEARKSLQESEERYRIILERTGQLVYDYDLKTNTGSWTGAIEEITGYAGEEYQRFDRATLTENIHPDDQEQITKTICEAKKTGEKFQEELRFKRKDGTYIYLENSGIFLLDEKGSSYRVLGVLKDITERKLAQDKRLESEEKYRSIVETANEGIIIIDDKARITFANHKMAEMFGYDVEDGIGRSLWDYMNGETRAVVEKNMEKWAYGIIETYEVELRCKDGSSLWAMVNSKPLFDKNGKGIGILAMLTDVTERKKAEEKRLESEEKYRNIIETTNEGIVVIDSGLRITYVNQKLMEKGGYLPEEVIGREWWDFTDEEGKVVAKQHMDKRRQGIDETYELKLMRKDGSPFWVLVSSKSLHDKDGRFSGSLSMLTDITEWKKAEEKLRESEEKYRSFIQSFEGIVFQLDNNFFPEFMYGEVEEITGYLEEAFLSGSVSLISSIHPEDVPFVLKDQEEIQSSPYNLYRKLDFRLVHRNGKIKWVREIYRKVEGENGKPDKYQGNLYDITEKKEAEIALGKMEEFRQKEIHHRIKNNLQVISSLLDLQAEKFINNRKCVKDSEILEAFRESQDRVVSIALIHEELHEGAGANTLNFSLYLKRLVKNLFHTYRLGHADISLNIELEERIFFDMDAAVPLGLIVNELVSNSLKHAFPGRETGKIQIKLYREDAEDKRDNSIKKRDENLKRTRFILMVSDNGIGISRAVDIKNSDTLGIQLVNLLVEQLEGEIEIKRDNGTEFIIKINVTEKL